MELTKLENKQTRGGIIAAATKSTTNSVEKGKRGPILETEADEGIIKNLKNNKMPGQDRIENETIKILSYT